MILSSNRDVNIKIQFLISLFGFVSKLLGRVLVLDGAMGTAIQQYKLEEGAHNLA
jgi:hypothetical protein